MVVVKSHMEVAKVTHPFHINARYRLFWSDTLFLGVQADGSAVGIVGADVGAQIARKFLEAYPDIGLDIFHQVTHMQRAVGVGQGAGDKYFALAHSIWSCC